MLASRFGLVVLSITVAATAVAQKPPVALPEMGSNVVVFRPTDDMAADQAKIDAIYTEQQHSEFGSGRYAILFAPGTYHLRVPIGFYTEVLGLGATPDAVRIDGDVRVDAALKNDNATTTFWRGAEGLSVKPESGTMQWAVSQAVEFRRMHVLGDMVLNQRHGWASGGWMSDATVDGTVNSGTQQQWIARNSEWKQWTGANWNMVFVGTPQMPEGEWPQPPFTKVGRTPEVREKPFLEQEKDGTLAVRVPGLRRDSSGVSWHGGETPGRVVPLSRFYVARADRDSAATINAALSQGKDLLLTPGIYDLDQPIRVTRKDATVLGLGFATLHAVKGTEAMTVADVDGVAVAGLLFDAGEAKSPSLLHVGTAGVHLRHDARPIVLHDVFFRVGGAAVGKVSANLVIDSDDTIVDHTWIWRADHGKAGVGWTVNESDNGLVVRGDRVTVYGLFVEHHEKYQVLWSGEAGRTYFYQSEIPYDPPTQAAWTDANGARGWASYKVADTVKQHEAWGLGVYSVFRHPDVVLDRAIEVPKTPEVRFHHMITVALDNLGAIENVIDDKGGPTQVAPHRVTPKVPEFP
ncbi:coagulation factor 5/8 type domain-containing protein [Terriglobus aquaticus]|uniref:Coagulation factor 5/8 type domain-containing protein n=1 Tax=Terriglobus aquaticus TaxID=940139 RepID=A0ABW9KJ24_9BACT|nr:coagulation factor 5/8 type domain-containing protein [Terriglobus aquaticus]